MYPSLVPENQLINFRISSLLVLFCFMVLLTGCPGVSPNGERLLLEHILSDFTFVGSGPIDTKMVPAHEMKALPIPFQLKPGYQYVFHHKYGIPNGDIYKELRTRLQANNFQITSPDAVMYRYLGGPGFRITFQGNGLKGAIYNVLDGQIINNEALLKEWSIDDYILVVESL